MGFGHILLWRYMRNPVAARADRPMHFWLYRVIQLGVLLLAAGTILGGVWANYSWGRFWGWDPKETWALIALLCYILTLHGRLAGWWTQFGLVVASVVCFLAVLMAWYGVNFVLGKGLHSYGFGIGGENYVGAFVLADLAISLAIGASWRYRASKSIAAAGVAPSARNASSSSERRRVDPMCAVSSVQRLRDVAAKHNAVVMIRPHRFHPNPETAADNAFQQAVAEGEMPAVSAAAQQEFDSAVETLRDAGVTVHVVDDTATPEKPDAVFPNNWFSTHHDGRVALYPMYSAARRRERRHDVIDELRKHYRITDVVDYSACEEQGHCLEGTGSLVLDHANKIAYASLVAPHSPGGAEAVLR